jgi:hypothetical protein
MSDITISVPSDPFRALIKSVIKDELQPTLYGNDNTLAGTIHEEIEGSPRVQDHLKSVVVDTVRNSSAVEDFINDSLGRAADNSPRFRRAIEESVSEAIDYSEIASNIEASDIADHISASDIAEAVSVRGIAEEICMDTLAERIADHELDYSKLARALLREIRAEAIKSST